MAAFNTIRLSGLCPAHGRQAQISAQTHVASSFDGDDRGRFLGHTYSLGERMRWWSSGSPDWRADTRKDIHDESANRCEEACYATCEECGAELCVVLEFIDLAPVAVLAITLENDWPAAHYM
jgi:hypothetical protein